MRRILIIQSEKGNDEKEKQEKRRKEGTGKTEKQEKKIKDKKTGTRRALSRYGRK